MNKLHNEIMNIPCKRRDSEFISDEDRIMYKEGHRDARHAAAELALQACSAQVATEWRCFHCEESFTDPEKARLHFGTTERQSPACQLDAAHLRELETELQKYREEDTELHHQIAGQAARMESAKRRAEEEGYARGLRDAAPATGAEGAQQQTADEIAELSRDAVRYQWLRNQYLGDLGGVDLASAAPWEIDKAIDAALAIHQPSEQPGADK